MTVTDERVTHEGSTPARILAIFPGAGEADETVTLGTHRELRALFAGVPSVPPASTAANQLEGLYAAVVTKMPETATKPVLAPAQPGRHRGPDEGNAAWAWIVAAVALTIAATVMAVLGIHHDPPAPTAPVTYRFDRVYDPIADAPGNGLTEPVTQPTAPGALLAQALGTADR